MAKPVEILFRARNELSDDVRRITGDLRGLDRVSDEAARSAVRVTTAQREQARSFGEAGAAANRSATDVQVVTRRIEELARESGKLDSVGNGLGSIGDQAQQSAGGVGSLTNAAGGLTSILGSLGIALGAAEILQFGVNAGRSALQLQRTENSVRLLAGSTENYENIVRLAKEQQILFGGSLNDNIAQLGALGGIASRTGVDLAILNDIAQRLVIKDPTANFGDASVALSEAFSGDITSLAERFELSRSELRKLTEEGTSAADKLKILDGVLNDLNIKAGAAATAIPETTKAYNELGAAFDNAKVKIGGFLSEAFVPLAQSATSLLSVFQGTRQGAIDAGAGILEFAQFTALGAGISDEAIVSFREQAASILGVKLATDEANGSSSTWGETQAVTTAATVDAAEAARLKAEALAKEAAESALSTAQSELAAQSKQQLADNARAAAQELLASGNASAVARAQMAAQYGVALELVNIYYQLEAAARAAAIAQAAGAAIDGNIYDDAGNVIPGRANRRPPRAPRPPAVAAAGQTAADVAAAQRRLDEARGGDAVRLKNLYADLAKQKQGSVEYLNTLAKIEALRTKGKGKGKGSAGSGKGTSPITRDDRADLALASDEQDLVILKRKLAGLKKGSTDYKIVAAEIEKVEARIAKAKQRAGATATRADSKAERDAEELERARDALLSEQELLDKRKAQLAANPPELRRLELIKEIKDLEGRITAEQDKQRKSAVEARLALIDDRKAKRDEQKKLEQARAVLNSDADAEMKQAARDVLERIPLEQAKRALEIAEKTKDAGGVLPVASGGQAQGAVKGGFQDVAPRLSGDGAAADLPRVPAVAVPTIPAGALAAIENSVTLGITINLDSKQIAGELKIDEQKNISRLRIGLNQAKSAGTQGQ